MIRIQSLSFSYWEKTNRQHSVLHNLSFELKKGEWGVLLGASGSGKSTLFSILAGFLFPFSGEVEIAGIKLNSQTVSTIRRKLGMMVQFPENQLFSQTVFEEIAVGLRAKKIPQEEILPMVKENLEKVGLNVGLEQSPFLLSLGEKRKLIFSAILAIQPEIFLLDEPTSGLDSDGKKILYSILRELKQEGKTILQTTHHLEEVLPYADWIVFLQEGKMILSCTPSEFLLGACQGCKEIQPFVPPVFLQLAKIKKRFPSFVCEDFSIEGIATSLHALLGSGP
jgi:energy-coupling factor transporter ATP-binding protein EcfA2